MEDLREMTDDLIRKSDDLIRQATALRDSVPSTIKALDVEINETKKRLEALVDKKRELMEFSEMLSRFAPSDGEDTEPATVAESDVVDETNGNAEEVKTSVAKNDSIHVSVSTATPDETQRQNESEEASNRSDDGDADVSTVDADDDVEIIEESGNDDDPQDLDSGFDLDDDDLFATKKSVEKPQKAKTQEPEVVEDDSAADEDVFADFL